MAQFVLQNSDNSTTINVTDLQIITTAWYAIASE